MHLKTSSAKWRPFCLSLNVSISILLFVFGGRTRMSWSNWFELKPTNYLSANARKLLDKFELKPTNYLSANARKLLDKTEARKQRQFSGVWKKTLIRLTETHDELGHPITAQSDGRVDCKCAETNGKIRHQGTAEIQWSEARPKARPGAAHDELAHQVWAQPNQSLICRYTEIARPITGQKTDKPS